MKAPIALAGLVASSLLSVLSQAETSGHLALFEDAFDAEHDDAGSLPPR
jgi:hypothetical protein